MLSIYYTNLIQLTGHTLTRATWYEVRARVISAHRFQSVKDHRTLPPDPEFRYQCFSLSHMMFSLWVFRRKQNVFSWDEKCQGDASQTVILLWQQILLHLTINKNNSVEFTGNSLEQIRLVVLQGSCDLSQSSSVAQMLVFSHRCGFKHWEKKSVNKKKNCNKDPWSIN